MPQGYDLFYFIFVFAGLKLDPLIHMLTFSNPTRNWVPNFFNPFEKSQL